MGGKRKRGAKANANENQPSRKKSKKAEATAASAPQDLDLDKSPFSEKLAAEDRKREQRIYDLLGSYDSIEHIAAADALVTGLLSSEEAALKRHLENRLFRGLASSRNASRIGFSLVITEILSQLFGDKGLADSKFTELTFDKVLSILLEKTQPSGGISGPEERDFYFGQLFGLKCFAEAKILFGKDGSKWPKILELLLKLADKKVWMKSHCAWVVVQTIPQMGPEKTKETLEKLVDAGWGKTAEGVGIWLMAASTYPSLKLPSKPWTDPLATKSIPELANVLKENVKQDTGNKEAAASKAMPTSWNSQLHFVWDIILSNFIAQTRTSKGMDTERFKLFWGTVIDDGLFSKNATEGQKYRGFLIFQKFLGGFAAIKDKSLVNELFSRNLMKCLVNQAAKEDRYLHLAANKSLKTLEEVVDTEPTFLLPVLSQLLGKHGAYDFDQRTKSKTVEKLLQSPFTEDAKAIFELLQKPIVSNKGDDASEVEKLRRVYADYLVKICTSDKAHTDPESIESKARGTILESAVKQMTACAYSKEEGKYSPELSDSTREYFRNRLESAFAKLTRRREDYGYLCNAVLAIDATAVHMSAEIETERKAAVKALKKSIKASTKSAKDSSLGLALLYAITILQLYNGDPDALSTLADLRQCSEKIKEADGDASALLVEILLSLVSRPSPMMRQVTQEVFESFTSQLTTDALERLIDPLTAEENLKGQQSLFDAEDEEMLDVAEGSSGSDDEEDEVDEDEISEIGSDVEFVTLNGAAPEDEEDSDDEADKDDTQAYADLDAKLEEILGSHRLDKDKDADSDDESDMTDSEMMQYDQKLAEVFKQRVQKPNKKKENQNAKDTMIIFKHRILEFLNIYVKKEAQNPQAFELLLPLLQLIRTTSTKEIGNKAIKVIGDFSDAVKKQKSKTGGSVELLQRILQEASKDQSHAFARATSTSALLVASSIDDVEKVMDVYYSSLKSWALHGATLQTKSGVADVGGCTTYKMQGFLGLALATLAVVALATETFESQCLAFKPETNIWNSTRTQLQYVPAGTNLTFPDDDATCNRNSQVVSVDLCRIALSIPTSNRSSITLELWLPETWTGRTLATGNGGIDGCIKYEDIAYAVANGFAAVGTNNGHNGTYGDAFYHNEDVVTDFAWRSLHTSAGVSKNLTAEFYGSSLGKSYYLGCSLGGRQGIEAAEMFPEDFDGIVAGAPAVDFNNLYSWRASFFPLTGASSDYNFISAYTWNTTIHDEVLRQCDDIDGVKDGIIEDPLLCHFEPQALLCQANSTTNCLNPTQVDIVEKVYSDYLWPNGSVVFPGMQPGSEIQAATGLYSGRRFARSYDWFRFAVLENPDWDASTYSIDDAMIAAEKNPGNVRTWPSSLAAFESTNGKILSFHGMQDEQITSFNSKRFYEHLSSGMGYTSGQMDNFYRYFRVPGMYHCNGGPGAWVLGQGGGAPSKGIPFDAEHNLLAAVVDWVEQGIAPETVLGTKFVSDDVAQGVDYTHRHCRWPLRSTYLGSGYDPPDANSWECLQA
ncbi:putative DNA polymerase V [Seiridium unicorne]|uniref:Carboxylic ester hydrolase n=1 Tax=Seiridium unicorne TaxID=138068 RepID=A0ABR2UT32_9PEZI